MAEGKWQALPVVTVTAEKGTQLRVLDDHSVLAGGETPETDTYTVEADFTPMERADFGLYYTYEKDFSRTQTGGTGTVAATALASLLTFDGSAKGGFVLAVQERTGIPVKLLGQGEGIDDLRPFDAREFVTAWLDGDGANVNGVNVNGVNVTAAGTAATDA